MEVGRPAKFGRPRDLELVDPLQPLPQLGYVLLGPGPYGLQQRGQPRAGRFTGVLKVAGRDAADLVQRQAEPAQPGNDADTPQRLLAEQPVVSRAAADRVDQPPDPRRCAGS